MWEVSRRGGATNDIATVNAKTATMTTDITLMDLNIFNNGRINKTGSPTPTLTVTNKMLWSLSFGLPQTNTPNLVIPNGSTMFLQGNRDKSLAGNFNLGGTVEHTEAKLTLGSLTTINASGIYNISANNFINLGNASSATFENNGQFNISKDGLVISGSSGEGDSFTNKTSGIFNRNGGTGTTTISAPFTNDGMVMQSTTGTLSFSSSFNNTSTGEIKGVGTYSFSSLTQNGTISPGNFIGSLALNQLDNTNGILNIELQDDGDLDPMTTGTAGTDYDLLNITGAATLGGTLNLSFLGGYLPTVGNKFTIMTCNPCSGAFADIDYPDELNHPNAFQVNIDGNDVILELVHPPGRTGRLGHAGGGSTAFLFVALKTGRTGIIYFYSFNCETVGTFNGSIDLALPNTSHLS